MRARLGRRDPASEATREAIAALNGWWREGHRGETCGAEVLEAVPQLLDAEPVAVIRAVFELEHPAAAPLLSAKWRERLLAAIRRADRYADFGAGRRGAGLQLALDMVLGDWQEHLPPGSRPKSLGAIAVCCRRQANRWRRHDRERRRAANWRAIQAEQAAVRAEQAAGRPC